MNPSSAEPFPPPPSSSSIIAFLTDINAISLDIPLEQVHRKVVDLLSETLQPFGICARLWVYNQSWKILEARDRHRPEQAQSRQSLLPKACPAFSQRKVFSYPPGAAPCCPSSGGRRPHLCLPVTNQSESFGALCLETDQKHTWDDLTIPFFETLAQSIAMVLQRKALFQGLHEKLAELHFSFEVRFSSMATFVGSTQGVDETTSHVLDGVLSILEVDRASLMLWDTVEKCLQTRWVRGKDSVVRSPLKLGMGEGMAGWALKTGQAYGAEYAEGDPHYVPSGHPVLSLLCVPLYTMDQQPLGVMNAVTTQHPRVFSSREVGFLKNFGQQAALAIEIAQLHQRNRANIERLKELDKSKSQFLSLVSHDLRGPLTGIRGFSEILKQQTAGPLNPIQLDLLDQLERQVGLQERMVDDLLDLARMEKGKLSVRLAPYDIGKLVKEEVDKSLSEANERRIRMVLSLPNTASTPEILLDEGRIRQVVWNLIHNAFKFTPEEGRVTVRLKADETRITVEVSDTGIGLSADVQERVFDKFFQISPGGSKSSQGLGLGLTICKEIILAHHGTIQAQSAGLGNGTTFTFILPISQVSDLPASPAPNPATN